MLLQDIWFFLWGLLWAVYCLTDGFDLGAGVLLPFIGKTEEERQKIYSAIGPLWNGNEVWLISAGGVTFAAFPLVYSVMFSSLYSALMLLLFGLIVRGVAVDLRGKSDSPVWKRRWDLLMFLGSLIPTILLGAAFGNIFKGLPIDKNGVYQGSFFTLLNPYGLMAGILFLLMFMTHGSLWLTMRSDGDLRERTASLAKKLWLFYVIAVVIFLIMTVFYTELFKNYVTYPILFLELIAAVIFLLGIRFYISKREYFKSWLSSALGILCIVFFGIIGLYPNMFPSSLDKAYSLTAHNASSSPLTLKIMLVVAILFVPIVLLYQGWAYKTYMAQLKEEDLYY